MTQASSGATRQQIDKNQAVALCKQALEGNRLGDAYKLLDALMQNGVLQLDLARDFFKRSLTVGDDATPATMLARFIELAPNNLGVHQLAMNFYEATAQWNKIPFHLDRCKALGHWTDYQVLLSAIVEERTLNSEKALAILDKAFPPELQPNVWRIRADAWNALRDDDNLLGPLQEYLAAYEGDHRLIAHSWKAVAAAYDRKKDFANAEKTLKLANAMQYRLEGVPVQRNALRMMIEGFKKRFTREWVDGWTPSVPHDQAPVFLIGFPRSGTTLLEQVLDSHPDIVAIEEKQTVSPCFRSANLVCESMAAVAGKPPEGASWLQLMQRRLNYLARFSEKQLRELQALYFRQVAKYIDLKPGQTLIDKMPLNSAYVGFIARMFPNARFIVALRHPADCVLSGHMQSFQMNDAMSNFLVLDDGASFYRHVMKLLWQYEEVLGLKDRMHYIRYEDLIGDLEGTVTPLLEFLGLDWDAGMANYAEHAKGRGSLATPSYQAVGKGLYTASRYRWHNYADYLRPVLPHLQEAAERYGYSLEMPEQGADTASQ
jgi:hypothetical protein